MVNQLARILITSGPTRQFIDPVRYLTNASSGRMGRALAEAALALGHEVVIVSGPVEVDYPPPPALCRSFRPKTCWPPLPANSKPATASSAPPPPATTGPMRVESHKIAKTGQPIDLHLIETDDVVATLGARKGHRWVVGFALETEDHRLRPSPNWKRNSAT